jgi:hypothetical protein
MKQWNPCRPVQLNVSTVDSVEAGDERAGKPALELRTQVTTPAGRRPGVFPRLGQVRPVHPLGYQLGVGIWVGETQTVRCRQLRYGRRRDITDLRPGYRSLPAAVWLRRQSYQRASLPKPSPPQGRRPSQWLSRSFEDGCLADVYVAGGGDKVTTPRLVGLAQFLQRGLSRNSPYSVTRIRRTFRLVVVPLA